MSPPQAHVSWETGLFCSRNPRNIVRSVCVGYWGPLLSPSGKVRKMFGHKALVGWYFHQGFFNTTQAAREQIETYQCGFPLVSWFCVPGISSSLSACSFVRVFCVFWAEESLLPVCLGENLSSSESKGKRGYFQSFPNFHLVREGYIYPICVITVVLLKDFDLNKNEHSMNVFPPSDA